VSSIINESPLSHTAVSAVQGTRRPPGGHQGAARCRAPGGHQGALSPSQPQLVGHFGGDILEGDGRAGDALEAHAVEREAGQLAHLHLPLDEAVLPRVAVHAEQRVALALLVVTVVGVQDPADLLHDVAGLHGGRGLHAPGEAQGARLRLPAVLLGVAGETPGGQRHTHTHTQLTLRLQHI